MSRVGRSMMLRDIFVPAALAVSAVTALSLPVLTYEELQPPPIAWTDDVDEGLSRAQHEDKPVVVYVGAEWDCAAKELEHVTFVDPAIRAIMHSDFVAIRIDATDEDSPSLRRDLERFKVIGEPALIILSHGSLKEQSRFNEFVKPDRLAPALLGVSASRGKYFF